MKLSGVASSDQRLSGVVTLKDSSTPAREKAVIVDRKGAFSFDVDGLTPPFVLKADLASAGSSEEIATSLHSVSNGGTANINPLTNAIVAGAANEDPATVYTEAPVAKRKETADNLAALSDELRVVLKPLLDQYQVTDPLTGSTSDSGMNAMLRDVSISVESGYVFVVNRSTGGLIYGGPAADPATGTFYPENMPPPPKSLKVAQPDPVVSAPEPTPSPDPTPTATPTPDPTATPVPQPTATPTPAPTSTPAACQYTYSTWSVCQADSTQSRSVLASSPSGCVGSPVLTQACSYVPPVCTYTYSAWNACQSDNTQTRTVTAALPAGCVGTPVVAQSCTYVPPACTYSYSAWSACQSNNTQTRSVLSSSPSGCAGNPVVSQACTYVPPASTSTLAYPPATTLARGSQPSLSEPALGASASYGDLSTKVTHVSDSRHHYAKTPVWNVDESLAVTNDGKIWNGTTYAFVRQVTLPNEHKTWSNTDPRYIYGANRSQRQWVRVDATTGTSTVLATYSQYSAVSYGAYEGNMDNNDTGAALLGDGKPFLINPKTGAVRCTITGGGGYGNEASDATMSQDGNYILVNWVGYGIDAYKASDCSFHKRVTTATSHYDACISTAGEQVVVQPYSGGYLKMYPIASGTAGVGTTIWKDSAQRIHVSCRNTKRPGWAYISIDNMTCDSTLTGMTAFHRIWATKLDGSQQAEIYGWDHQACPAPYSDNPMAVPSRLGNRVWFKAVWDGSSSGLHSFVAERR